LSRTLASGASHAIAPVQRFNASTCASSVSRNTRSPASATPRFAQAAAPAVRARLKCQTWRPLPASSANTSFGCVTYMRPSATTGVTWSELASGSANVQRGARRATFAGVMPVSAV
jgi:hypothetical protein